MNRQPEHTWPFMPFGVEQIDQLKIAKAQGTYLYTESGQKILDASAGAAVGNIGWGRREVGDAVAGSLSRSSYVLPTFMTDEREKLVASLASEWLPAPLNKVSFMGSGSEAVDNAVRLARQYQLACGRNTRWKVIGRDVSYHGTSLAGLAVGGHAGRRQAFEPMLMQAPHAPPCYCLRCPFGKQPDSCKLECAAALEGIIEQEGEDTIAAFIAEPIVGASGGALVPPDDYWPKIADICRRHDILLIVDEVMTGFGRTGKNFAIQHWNVTPDLLVLGKGLSGGYATISAVATSESFCQRLTDAGLQAMYHTYGAHPAACAAAIAVLDILRKEQLVERVARLSPVFNDKLQRLQIHPNVAEVRGKGFLFAIEVVKDAETLEQYPQADAITLKIIQACLRRNCFVYFGGTGVVRDIILIAPHFTISEEDMDFIVDTLLQALNEACIKKSA